MLCLNQHSIYSKRDKRTYPVSCGKCLSCLINRRSEKTARMLLQAQSTPKNKVNLFATYTYRDSCLPENKSVTREDINRIQRNLKNKMGGFYENLYAACGEYGSYFKTIRPHYHFIQYDIYPGWKPINWSESDEKKYQEILHEITKGNPQHPPMSHIIYPGITREFIRAWSFKGNVMIKEAEPKDMAYIAKYITKPAAEVWKLKVLGLESEFFTSSKKKILGLDYLKNHITRLDGMNIYPSGYPLLAKDKYSVPIELRNCVIYKKWETVRGRRKVRNMYLPIDKDVQKLLLQHWFYLRFGRDSEKMYQESRQLFKLKRDEILRDEQRITQSELVLNDMYKRNKALANFSPLQHRERKERAKKEYEFRMLMSQIIGSGIEVDMGDYVIS